MFGFPYNRHWEEIGKFITSSQFFRLLTPTNEKPAIAEWSVPGRYSSNKAGFYIHVAHPQSFSETLTENEKVLYWTEHYPPVRVFKNGQRVVAEVYFMPAGSIEEIRSAGY